METLTTQQKYLLGLFSYLTEFEQSSVIYEMECLLDSKAVIHVMEQAQDTTNIRSW